MSRARILVVDDDMALAETIRAFLESEGFQAQTARDGVQALSCVAENAPSLVLLDMYMPVMDGKAFAQALRAQGRDLPIVVMTAAGNARRCAEEIGAAAYIGKPLSLPMLLLRIDSLCA
jgi:DNA-binding response OmpR family regulator